MRLDFDAWRAGYDSMTYAENVEFYRKVADEYPEQRYYNAPAVLRFLTWATEYEAVDVLELGGWKGELADEMLPLFGGIRSWLNVEIAPQVIDARCSEPRYSVIVPDDYLWNLDADLTKYRVLVASHVIEHLKVADIHRLLERLSDIRYFYIDAPLPDTPSAWGNGESSHIIEIGWDGLVALVESHGFTLRDRADGQHGPAMWFQRIEGELENQ